MRQYKEIPKFSPAQLDKFWSLVDRKNDSECWPWKGGTTTGKYGGTYGQFRGFRPHRIVYTLLVGRIPVDLTIDHVRARCEMGSLCMNPAHMEPVPQSVNSIRYQRSRTHCKRGHPIVIGQGACRVCARDYGLEYKLKRWAGLPTTTRVDGRTKTGKALIAAIESQEKSA